MRRIDSLPQYGPHVDATERMHAVVVTRYGGPDVLEYSDVPRPAVRSGQVLVKSAYIGVNPKDVIVRKGKFARMTGKKFPLIVGHDIAGQVIASGPKTDLQVGDKVYGMINDFAGRAYAQYAAVDIDQLARIPDGLSMQEAAAIPLAAQTALQALRDDGKLKSGQRVLINGASGGVGTFAVQIAKIMGAHVTAVCSEKNRALVEELGADVHVDYKTTDILAGPGRYDIVFDVFGNYIFEAFKHKLTAAGRYVNTVPSGRIVRSIVTSVLSRKKARLVIVRSRRAQLDWLSEQYEAGAFKAVIDREFALSDAPEAHRFMETKRARGKVVLRPEP